MTFLKSKQNNTFNTKVSKSLLITTYKSFSRPYLHYVDIIYNLANKSSLHLKLELSQYYDPLAITTLIRETLNIPTKTVVQETLLIF